LLPTKFVANRGPLDVGPGKMGDRKIVNEIIAHMEKPHTQPQFVACGLFRPHLPWYLPRAIFDEVPLESVVPPLSPEYDLDDVPSAGIDVASKGSALVKRAIQQSDDKDPNLPSGVQAYLASIVFSDKNLGMLLDSLDGGSAPAMNTENTIVVVWR